MALSASSIAIRCADKDAVLALLRLEDTDQPISWRQARSGRKGRSGVACLSSGWIYIIGPAAELDERQLKAVSRVSLLIASSLKARIRSSTVDAYLMGKRVWYVLHDASQHQYHLRARGDLPPQFKAIREGIRRANGRNQTIIDIPLELAKSVCGARPDSDRDSDGLEIAFTALEAPRSPKPTTPFFHRLKVGLKNGWKAFRRARRARMHRRKGAKR